MKNKCLILTLICTTILCCSRKTVRNERFYQERWCLAHGGKVEVVMSDRTRCDCLTPTHAIEFDFAGKWEALEQALHYARLTGKKAGIVFICRKPGDRLKIERTLENIRFYKLPVKIWRENC